MKRISTLILLMVMACTAMHAATPADSLSYYLGATQGAMIKRQLSKMPIADSRFREGLLKGLGAVLDVDTSDVGYTEGLLMGMSMVNDLNKIRHMGANIDTREVYAQIRHGILSPELSYDEINAANARLSELVTPLMQRAQELENAKAERDAAAFDSICTANLDAGDHYVDSVKNHDRDLKFTDSGLAYKMIRKGKGSRPRGEQSVNVKYTGYTTDGKQFDSSNGEAVKFMVNGVIRGFAEGLQLMNPGSLYRLIIPGELAYGPKGVPGKIGPMQMLIFDVELVSIEDN